MMTYSGEMLGLLLMFSSEIPLVSRSVNFKQLTNLIA